MASTGLVYVGAIMGGLGSGRSGWKPKAEYLFQIDIRTIHKASPLREGQSLCISHPDATSGVNIILTWTALNYGGKRPWFLCPSCHGRVAILYLFSQQFLCRDCHDITYSSRCEGTMDILLRRERKLHEKLGGHFLVKPKGMHLQTFERILGEALELDEQIKYLLMNQFGEALICGSSDLI